MIKLYLRKVAYMVPGAQALWIKLNTWQKKHPEFRGWGMTTNSFPPWYKGGGDDVSKDFLKAHEGIFANVSKGRFKLTQYENVQDKAARLRELMWRHYVVFWTVQYASYAARDKTINLVECGVCDGLTVYFAMSALPEGTQFKAYLYDAWERMEDEDLLESEKKHAGDYAYLELENAKRNLVAFERETVFIKGFIPESFKNTESPTEVVWMHIDLNASLPTTAALRRYFDAIPPGGVILFDDYAWRGYEDTKVAVDRFFSDKKGVLLPMPTGQAIFFKH